MPAPNRNIVESRQNYYSYVTRSASGAVTSSGSNITTGLSVYFRDILTTVSVQTPNFRRLKELDRPNNNYYKYTLHKYEPGGVYVQLARNVTTGVNSTYTYDVNLAHWDLTITDDPSTDADDLTQKLISKLITEISLRKTDLAVSMAELGKTAQHLAHTATRVYTALKGLRAGRFGDFANALGVTYSTRDVRYFNRKYKQAFDFDRKKRTSVGKFHTVKGRSRVTDFAADTWLEYSYAWKPLLFDIYTISEATASVMVGKSAGWRYCTVKAFAERNTGKRVVSNQNLITSSKSSRRFGAMGVRFAIPDGALSITSAFGLNNPAVVVWELVPFSFVVDWFLPVGNAIAALTAFNGLVFHSGWQSTRHSRVNKKEITAGPAYTTGGVKYTVLKSNIKGEQKEHGQVRSVLTNFPVYGFPKWKDPRSFAHAASAIALLQSLFLRR